MDTANLAFLVLLIVGFGMLLVSAIFGELSDLMGGGDADISGGDGNGADGPSWVSITLISVALTGLGAVGLLCLGFGLNPTVSALIAVASGIVFAVLVRQFVIMPLMRQQANTSISQTSYVGTVGSVSLDIAAGSVGEVRIVDHNGALVAMPARASEAGVSFKRGESVVVDDVVSGRALVRTPSSTTTQK